MTAVHLAAENNLIDAISMLAEHGADVKAIDKHGVTPIMLAAQKGDLETINLLLTCGEDLNRQDFNHRLPLYHAAEGNHTNIVKFRLHVGGNLLATTSSDETVLHLATRLELVTFLVEQGADIHAKLSLKQRRYMLLLKGDNQIQ